jgi:hypothetical protein
MDNPDTGNIGHRTQAEDTQNKTKTQIYQSFLRN